MALSTQIIHVIPLQISITDSIATITCNDPRAELDVDSDEIRIDLAEAKDPRAQQRVVFVVDDPPDAGGYDNYFNMSSAPPLERLVAWKRSGSISRSLEMLTGFDFEVVAVAFSVPQADAPSATAVKIGHGRRRFQIRIPGAGGSTY